MGIMSDALPKPVQKWLKKPLHPDNKIGLFLVDFMDKVLRVCAKMSKETK